MNKVFKVGLIGCGHISETYFRGHDYFNNFQIVKCADINEENELINTNHNSISEKNELPSTESQEVNEDPRRKRRRSSASS